MKNKKTLLLITGLMAVVISFSIIINFKTDSQQKQNVIKDFSNIILSNEEYLLTQPELQELQTKIINSEVPSDDIEQLKAKYTCLAYILYLLSDYDQSLDYFEKANQLAPSENPTLQLMVLTGLSKSNMALGNDELSYQYFEEALLSATEINEDFLSKEYQSHARTVVTFNKGISNAITLMHEALKLDAKPSTMISNYLYLSNLYLSKQDYSDAIESTKKALNLAIEHDIPQLKNRSVKQLADIYYVQEKYNQAIILYERLLSAQTELSVKDQMDSLAYLGSLYALINEFSLAHERIDTAIEIIGQLHEFEQPKEFNWIYLVQAKTYLLQNKLEASRQALDVAIEYYNQKPTQMYPNTDVWIEELKLDLIYQSKGANQEIFDDYVTLAQILKEREVQDELYKDIRRRIIEISLLIGDEETAIRYLTEKVQDAKEADQSNFHGDLSEIITQLDKDLQKQKISSLQRFIILNLIIIFVLIIMFIYNTHARKKIKQLNRILREQNITDYLTQVYNKKYLYEYLESLMNKRQPLLCMLIDIDYFKRYNDTYGHLAGDDILKQIGQLLKEQFPDDAVFRYGGEEFCIISTGSTDSFIEKVERLYRQLEELQIEHKASLVQNYITLSSGIEQAKLQNISDIEKILFLADSKLYLAKKQGRNRYII